MGRSLVWYIDAGAGRFYNPFSCQYRATGLSHPFLFLLVCNLCDKTYTGVIRESVYF